MVKTLKLIRFRIIFTAIFLLFNKVCLANTAKFEITPFYEVYYGFNANYTVTVPDKIFFLQNGGMRVMCNATEQKEHEIKILKVFWFEMIDNDKYIKMPELEADGNGLWDPGNKTLLISAGLSHPDLNGMKVVCGTTENGYTQYSTPQTLTLAYLDPFSSNLAEKSYIRTENLSVYMVCVVPSGVPEPAVYWTHNGTRLNTDNNPHYDILASSTLGVKTLTFSDAGEYRCFAVNSAGAVKSPRFLVHVEMLNKHLSFLETPKDAQVTSGDRVILTCRFNRKPAFNGWLFKSPEDGSSKSGSPKWTILETGDLIITKVDRNDSGKYTCYGRDDDNNLIKSVYITVKFFDTTEARGPGKYEVVLGHSITIQCFGPDSYPASYITIYKDGVEVLDSAAYSVKQEDRVCSLTISEAKLKDTGEYSCAATDGDNLWRSDEGQLKVVEDGIRPHEFLGKRKYEVDLREDVELTCSVLADPAPSISWFVYHGEDVIPVNTSDRVVFGSSGPSNNRYNFTLSIKNVTLHDHKDKYSCRLSNKLGTSDSPKMSVLVNHITCQTSKAVQKKYFNIQEPIQVACPQSISAYPKEVISWSYNKSDSSLIERDSTEILYSDSMKEEDAGSYTCETSNTGGSCKYQIQVVPSAAGVTEGDKTLVIIVAALAFIVVLVVLFIAILQIRKRVKKKKLESSEALERLNQPRPFTTNVNGYEDGPSHALLPSPTNLGLTDCYLYSTLSKFSQWHITRSRLKQWSVLGEGQFGSVYKAELMSPDGASFTPVAVKQIKDDNNPDAILEYEKEMLMMTELHHPNIIKLIGLCTDVSPYYILTEFMDNGNLTNFLQEIAQSKQGMLSLPQQIHVCAQIASGLKYMADKEFVHRDVAARNCLVGRNLLVKVADFGLSRSVRGREIYQKEGGTVPIRWMSPEAIQYGQYTTANDVWAYGITLWEVFSYGVIPYSAWSNEDVAANVQNGSRLIRPDACPQQIYNLMLECWAEHPDHRPTFSGILEALNAVP